MRQRGRPHLSRIAHFFASGKPPCAGAPYTGAYPVMKDFARLRERQTARPRDALHRNAVRPSVGVSHAEQRERESGPFRVARRPAGHRRLDARHGRSRDRLRAARPSHAVVLSGRRLSHRTSENAGALWRAVAALRAARRARIALVGARPHAFHAPVLPARALHAARGAGTRPRAARTDARRSHLFRRRPHRQSMSNARQTKTGRIPTACCAPTKPRIRC